MTDADLITLFHRRINAARHRGGFRLMSRRCVARKLEGRDLRELYAECRRARSFSFAFWSRMVPRTFAKGPRLPEVEVPLIR